MNKIFIQSGHTARGVKPILTGALLEGLAFAAGDADFVVAVFFLAVVEVVRFLTAIRLLSLISSFRYQFVHCFGKLFYLVT